MKYQFVDEHARQHRTRLMCKVLGLSRSSYYHWQLEGRDKRENRDRGLLNQIQTVYQLNQGRYGSPRITDELRDQGLHYGKNRIARVMKKYGLRAKTKRKFKLTTHSDHSLEVSNNLVDQNFFSGQPNRLWTSDITYIWTREGWLYLTVILDVFSRKLVGWRTSARLTTEMVRSALVMALNNRKPDQGLVFHSDRGSQYASREIRSLLEAYGIEQSMSGRGNCYDNAITESVFHTLKTELIFWERYQSRQEATSSIFEYIEVYYNRQRKHSAIGYKSPVAFEQQFNLS